MVGDLIEDVSSLSARGGADDAAGTCSSAKL
jgi:hypothetical protein